MTEIYSTVDPGLIVGCKQVKCTLMYIYVTPGFWGLWISQFNYVCKIQIGQLTRVCTRGMIQCNIHGGFVMLTYKEGHLLKCPNKHLFR